MNYTYEVPKNIKNQLSSILKSNQQKQLSELISLSVMEFKDVGYAYYAGIKGDNWDKHAVDCIMRVPEAELSFINNALKIIKLWIGRLLPDETGLLIRDIIFIPQAEGFVVDLPDKDGENWATLYEDIVQALAKNEPTLVLDRLHTFASKFFREVCSNNGIDTKDDKGNQYPLQSLIGMLAKYYKNEGVFDSDFPEVALKCSISVFDKFNNIRNEHSFAHDNNILNNIEATFVVKTIAAAISFVDDLESSI